MYVNIRVSRHLKEELSLAIDKWLRLIINTMLFKWPTLSLGHIISHTSVKNGQVTKSKKNFETNLKVHGVMQLSLSYKVFRWHPLNIML